MTAKKKRTRVLTVPEGHTVAYHEVLKCTVCNREYWGACSWDAHWPCNNEEYTRTAHQIYFAPSSGQTFFKQDVKPYVVLACRDRYETMQAKSANMRGEA